MFRYDTCWNKVNKLNRNDFKYKQHLRFSDTKKKKKHKKKIYFLKKKKKKKNWKEKFNLDVGIKSLNYYR